MTSKHPLLIAASLAAAAAMVVAVALSAAPARAGTISANLKAVSFAGTSLGYAAGSSGTILKTTDGGATWAPVWSGGASYDLRGIAANGTSGWAVDRAGALVRSSDSGGTWGVTYDDISQYLPYDSALNATDFAAPATFMAAGTGTDAAPLVFQSRDSGDSFELNDVFAAGDYPWPLDPEQFPMLGLGEFYGIDLVSSSRGWAVGHDVYDPVPDDTTPGHNDGIIWEYDTSHAGSLWGPWEKQASFPASGPLYGVSFGSTSWGIAVGAGGHAYYTTNGGTTWTPGTTGVTANLRAVAVGGMSTAWAVGDGGVILRTTDGGANWSSQSVGTAALYGVASVGSGTTAVAVGAAGTILRTTNGTAWAPAGTAGDTTKPTISHNALSAYTTSASITLTAADTGGSGVANIKYTLDTGTEVTVAGASATVSTSILGPHTLTARSYDGAGNPSDPVTANFTVYAPATVSGLASSTHPSGTAWYPARTATFTWTGASAAGYSYVFDHAATTVPDATQETAAASVSILAATDGVWYFHVRGVNGAGLGGNTVHLKVQIDSVKPTLNGNALSAYSGSASIALSAADIGGSGVANIKYTLDTAGEVTVAGASATVGTSVLGPHTLTARSYDGAGNPSDPITANFTVYAPVTVSGLTSSTHPGGTTWYPARTATFTWAGSSAVGYSYSLDALPTTVPDTIQDTAASSASVTAPSDGVWYFHVRGVNGAGAWGAASHFKIQVGTAPPAGVTYVALSGNNRYETCVAISKKAFPTPASVKTVIIATGENWPDALGGAALAKAYGGPILLVQKGAVPAVIMNEITRLHATDAVILGGTGSVSSAVETALNAKLTGVVSRIQGANRYETSRKIAARAAGTVRPGWAFVATGKNFADALAGSPISAAFGWPIYLVGSSVTATDINAMKAAGVHDVVILGGTGAVPGGVETTLRSYFGVTRQAGTTRYATALKVATYGKSRGLTWDKAAIATGANFPDALSGGALQGKSGSVMLLTPGTTLDPGVSNVLKANKATIHEVRFLGGLSTVTTTVRNAVMSALR